jgi:hypothetical protein
MRTKLVLASLLLLAVGVAGWAWGPARPRRVPATVAPMPVLTVRAESPEPGVVAVWADARVTLIHRDGAVLWYVVQVQRPSGPDDWEMVGTWEFSDPEAGEMVRSRLGVAARPVLRGRRITLPAGRYSIFVSVHEDARELRPDGSVAEPSSSMVGRAVAVQVR